MTIDGLVAAASTCQRFQLVGQHTAHSHRIHLYQLWEHLAELARQVLPVLLHLSDEVLASQQRVETSIGSRVDIGRQVLRQVVDTVGQQVFVQLVKYVTNGLVRRIALQQRIDKFVTHINEQRDVLLSR